VTSVSVDSTTVRWWWIAGPLEGEHPAYACSQGAGGQPAAVGRRRMLLARTGRTVGAPGGAADLDFWRPTKPSRSAQLAAKASAAAWIGRPRLRELPAGARGELHGRLSTRAGPSNVVKPYRGTYSTE